jgi:putative FmdB family regulatory protein
MPRYDFHCHKCGHTFERTTTVSQHEKERRRHPACPACGSRRVTPTPTAFQPITTRKG